MKHSNNTSEKYFFYFLPFIVTCIGLSSCKKLVEIDSPIDAIVGREIYSSNTGAASVLTGIYTNMGEDGVFAGKNSISVMTGVSGDELVPVTINNVLNFLYTNSITNQGDQLPWTSLYYYVFRINAAIEGISASTGITPAAENQLLGEAFFLRAFMYFYLVNLYDDVPLLTTTDAKINAVAGRTDKNKVYEQIISDLKEAQQLLGEAYVNADAVSVSSVRLRPNKSAASALLARVYLYTGQWSLAEQESTTVINNSGVYLLEPLTDVFLTTSKEAIWQLQSTNLVLSNALDGRVFVLASGNGLPEGPNVNNGRPVYINNVLYDEIEDTDQRKYNWINVVTVAGNEYPYAYKYKVWMFNEPRTENLTVLRLGEQYLIRAEARAHQGKIIGSGSAAEDVNTIRTRAELSNTPADNEFDMLNAILQERQIELFTEFGHRWFDLKRTGKINEVMNIVAPAKGGTWDPYKSAFPIPINNILNNPSLAGHQNPGYPETN